MTDNQSAQLKPGRRINVGDVGETQKELETGKRFEIVEELDVIDGSSEFEQELEPVLKPKSSRFNFKGIFVISLLLLIAVETGYTIIEAMQESILLAGLYGFVLTTALLVLSKFLFKEAVSLKALKQQNLRQNDALRLMSSTQIGEAETWLQPLLKQHTDAEVKEFKACLKPHHTDKEVLHLYQTTLLVSKDEQAKAIINQHAKTSALLVSLSPMALLDMLSVLWRGISLIEKISQHYGIKLAYRSRIMLYKQLVKQMLFAGASELVSDLAATSLGAELLGKLSARAAQGLSAGVFTARLGYKTMELCRPLPKLEQKQSLLGQSAQGILSALLERTKTSKND
ncbi:TIGR01620 family protein [Pseudoalteromonas phenolica]|uniref:TIGR01620 family protein n=1 Tax=Pseudoalteromonas phenolica TaxID=161398 RepID=UPI00110A357C|nr:TIGR01620 family protein [Pseudoalteromonas phenolica]TMN91754.1 TIGR01620 family protein [Pseudoalteromonas phenolica]